MKTVQAEDGSLPHSIAPCPRLRLLIDRYGTYFLRKELRVWHSACPRLWYLWCAIFWRHATKTTPLMRRRSHFLHEQA